MKSAASLCLLTFFLPIIAFADCDPFKSYQDILKCVIERHPSVLKSQSDVARSRLSEEVAAQRVNPEFNSKSVFGTQAQGSSRDVEVTLAHTFELGGKRDSRIERAKAETNSSLAEHEKTREEIYLATLLALYRIRQTQEELEIINRSLNTFETIRKQYRGRARLSPEQEISFNIYELAIADYGMKRSSLVTEFEGLKKNLELSVGLPLQLDSKLLPPEKKNWPKLEEEKLRQDISQSSSYKLSRAELQSAGAVFEMEKSLAWPDLKIGPTFQNQVQGAENSDMWGFSLSLSLPIFQANGAGKAAALAGVDRSTLSLKLTEQHLKTERDIEVSRYKAAVQSLSDLPMSSQVDKRSQKMRALFNRGVVPSSLVVEAERQLLEFTKSKEEQELRAVEALAKIYATEGRLLEMDL